MMVAEKDGTSMRRMILLAGVLPFVSAFLGSVLAFSLTTPSSATAQPNQLQEVRASAFAIRSLPASTPPVEAWDSSICTMRPARGAWT
jgi:hypothetical protein